MHWQDAVLSLIKWVKCLPNASAKSKYVLYFGNCAERTPGGSDDETLWVGSPSFNGWQTQNA